MTTEQTFSDRLYTLTARLDNASGLLKHAAITKTTDQLSGEVGIKFITELEEELDALIATVRRAVTLA
tara:strand:+ start:288 stop:491 length:204 start_codon:yes stop_codon:yes gene_type:complete